MTVYNTFKSNDPSTLHLDFWFKGSSIGCFEIPIEFYEEHLDADPRPDPFEVLEALIDHLYHFGEGEVVMARQIHDLFKQHRSHILSLHLYGELDRVQGRRKDLARTISELIQQEVDLRNELQALSI